MSDGNRSEEARAPVASSLVLETMPYQPDGGFGAIGSAVLIVMVMLGGVGMGFLASWIGQYFYLIILFPVIIGFVLGTIGVFGIVLGKVRNPYLGGAAGFIGGCVAMITIQYADYQRFLGEVEEMVAKEQPKDPARPIKMSFLQYVDFRAHLGVEITRAGRGGGINLGYIGTYIYWLVEILIVAGIAFWMGRFSAGEPFCLQCHTWKDFRKLGTVNVHEIQIPVIVEAIKTGAVGRLLEHRPGQEGGPVVVNAAICPNCGPRTAVEVRLDQLIKNDKGEESTHTLALVTYQGEALQVLETIFTSPAAAEPPAAG